MKIYGDRGEFFKEFNDVLNKHDWRHDNYNKYTIYLEKIKVLFSLFDYKRRLHYDNLLNEFEIKWGKISVAQELIKKASIMFDFQFFFTVRIPDEDPNNSFGYQRKKIKFNKFEMIEDLDKIIEWCEKERVRIYSEVTINYLAQDLDDEKTINENERKQLPAATVTN